MAFVDFIRSFCVFLCKNRKNASLSHRIRKSCNFVMNWCKMRISAKAHTLYIKRSSCFLDKDTIRNFISANLLIFIKSSKTVYTDKTNNSKNWQN